MLDFLAKLRNAFVRATNYLWDLADKMTNIPVIGWVIALTIGLMLGLAALVLFITSIVVFIVCSLETISYAWRALGGLLDGSISALLVNGFYMAAYAVGAAVSGVILLWLRPLFVNECSGSSDCGPTRHHSSDDDWGVARVDEIRNYLPPQSVLVPLRHTNCTGRHLYLAVRLSDGKHKIVPPF